MEKLVPVNAMQPNAMNQKKTKFLLLIILLAGIILRFYDLGRESYNPDEVFSIQQASLTLNEIIGNSENEPHPPLYYTLLHYWINAFGSSNIAARSLSSLFGIISIYIMFKLGRLLFNSETGIIASLIVAISAFQITYSQETRMYSLMAMLTLASMFFFIKLMRENDIRIIVCYLLSSTLLMYSHIYGFFILLAQNLYLMATPLISTKQKQCISLKKWVNVQILLLAAFIPWLWVFIRQIIGVSDKSFVNINWLPLPHLSDLFNTFYQYAYYNPITLAIFSLLSLSALITWKIFGGSRHMQNSDTSVFLFIWLSVPILAPYVISELFFPIYFPKYTISASLAFFLLSAKGISQINNRYLKGFLLGIVIYLSATGIIYNFH